MSKPSLRQHMLLRSVNRLLDADEQVHRVILMWTRHRLFVPYCALAGAALFVIAGLSDVGGVFNQVVLGACGVAVAGLATTNYSVLAETNEGLVLMRSSRVRQYAKAVQKRLPADTPIEMVASTVITSDWRVDDVLYTLTKRWEPSMRQLATGL